MVFFNYSVKFNIIIYKLRNLCINILIIKQKYQFYIWKNRNSVQYVVVIMKKFCNNKD